MDAKILSTITKTVLTMTITKELTTTYRIITMATLKAIFRSPFRRLLIAPGHYVAFAGSSPIRSLIKRETPQGPLAIHHAYSFNANVYSGCNRTFVWISIGTQNTHPWVTCSKCFHVAPYRVTKALIPDFNGACLLVLVGLPQAL
ncbi:hypothetical protein WN51_13176 [Melipona quadrifasciata]|uniref:Uncharacterized protein n=1 Tax=Melipona quadrifasciata TaxID=166423 RepID=A0A0N0BGM0_9HYME|nr:hypothetical protein WN51_13176 [Melipona quadrifasciata]